MKQEIGAINYEHIATLAENNGVKFECLCSRAENGAQTDSELLAGSLRQPNADWLTTEQAARHLAMTYSTFVSTLMDGDLEYYGIHYRSRSRIKPEARRGCGVLYDRHDLDEVMRLRRAIGSSTIAALRVFQAMRKGLI